MSSLLVELRKSTTHIIFVGEGTFTGWTNVALSRAYDELTSNNDLYPAETFVYRPDLVKNTPEKMKRAQMLWQETN